jgi:hypothetical protein
MTKKSRKPPAPSKTTMTGILKGPRTPRKPKSPKPPPGAYPLVRMLPCPLTDAERNERAMKAVELGSSIEREIAEVAERNTLSRKILRGLRDDAHRYQQEALNGVELREVQCEELPRMDDGKVVLIRSDTGEYVEDLRPITAADTNLNLFEGK